MREGNIDLDAAQDADVMVARLLALQVQASATASGAAQLASHEAIFGGAATDFSEVHRLTEEVRASRTPQASLRVIGPRAAAGQGAVAGRF